MSIAAVECELGLYAISRAETGTGADYWLVKDPTKESLETALRLEVSGIDAGDAELVKQRLRAKVAQLVAGFSSAPGYACVVGFGAARIAIDNMASDND